MEDFEDLPGEVEELCEEFGLAIMHFLERAKQRKADVHNTVDQIRIALMLAVIKHEQVVADAFDKALEDAGYEC